MLCLCDESAHAVYVSGMGLARFASAQEEAAAFAKCRASAQLRDQVRVWPPYRDLRPLLAMAADSSLRGIVNPPKQADPGFLLPGFLRAADLPVHFLVQGQGKRCRASGVSLRVMGWDPPENSFYQVNRSNDKVMVPAAPLHLLLRATELDLLDLALLVCEYCGDYWTRPDLKRGQMSNVGAPTTRKEILNYLAKLPPHIPGKARLQTATELAFDNSKSPRESGLALLETYRSEDVGFGLPRPLLNEPVELPASARVYVDGLQKIAPDEIWDGTEMCSEYESDQHHGGNQDPQALEKRKHDENRRRALEESGYTVHTIFADDLRDADSIERTMKRLAKGLGVQPDWAPVSQWLEPLRQQLLGYRCVI